MAEVCAKHWVHDSSCDGCRSLTWQARQEKSARESARQAERLTEEYRTQAAWERAESARSDAARVEASEALESRLWGLESELDKLRARAEAAEAALAARVQAEADAAAAAARAAERERVRAERAAAREAADAARAAEQQARQRLRAQASAPVALARLEALQAVLGVHVTRLEGLLAGDPYAPALVAEQVAVRHYGRLLERLRDDWQVEQDRGYGLDPRRHLPVEDQWGCSPATRDVFRQGREAVGEPYTPAMSNDEVVARMGEQAAVWHQVALAGLDGRALLAGLHEAFEGVDGFESLPGVADVVAVAEAAILEEELLRPRALAAKAAYNRWERARFAAVVRLGELAHGMRSDMEVIELPGDLFVPGAYADMLAALGLPADPGVDDPGPEGSQAVTMPAARFDNKMLVRADEFDTHTHVLGLQVPGETPATDGREGQVGRRRRWGFGRSQ